MALHQLLPFLSVAIAFTCGCSSAPEFAVVGDRAPDFELPVASGSEMLTTRSLDGEVVVLNFWSTTCAVCLQEMAELKRLNSQSNVRVVGIALDEDATRVRRMIEARGIDFEVVMGTPAVFEKYDGYAIPHTVVLDQSQVVRSMVTGRIDYDSLKKTVDELSPPAPAAMTSL